MPALPPPNDVRGSNGEGERQTGTEQLRQRGSFELEYVVRKLISPPIAGLRGCALSDTARADKGQRQREGVTTKRRYSTERQEVRPNIWIKIGVYGSRVLCTSPTLRQVHTHTFVQDIQRPTTRTLRSHGAVSRASIVAYSSLLLSDGVTHSSLKHAAF